MTNSLCGAAPLGRKIRQQLGGVAERRLGAGVAVLDIENRIVLRLLDHLRQVEIERRVVLAVEHHEADGVAADLVDHLAQRDVRIKPHKKFEAEVYILSKDEGGRHTPFFSNYRPQFYFRTTDVTGSITLPEGVEMVMPGDNVRMTVELITPIACEEGLRFAIREGGRTVGAGVVTKVIE